MTITTRANGVKPGGLTTSQLFGYAGPHGILFLARAAGFGIIPALYAERFDITLDKIAGILLLMRIVEAALQLVAGRLTDATARGRFHRKVWVVMGTAGASIGIIFLYTPPASAGLYYLGLWLSLVALIGSVTEVAYYSWGAEITNDYSERGRVATVQQWAAIAGQLLFFGLPLLPFTPTTEITFETLGLIAVIVGVTTPILLAGAWFLAPLGNPGVGVAAPTIVSLVRAILANRPMQWLLLGGIFFDIAASVAVGVGFLFIDSYLQAGELVSYQGLLQMGGAFVGVSITGYFITRLQKHRVWAVSCCAYTAMLSTALLLTPSNPYAGTIYVGITTMSYLLAMGAVVAPNSIIGDVVDYERWRSGRQQAGQFVAAFQLTQKLIGGLATALGFFLLSLFGFEPGQDSYDSRAAFGIKFVAIFTPAFLMAFSGLVAWHFPLNRRRQTIVRRRLETRDRRRSGARKVVPARQE